MAVETVEIDSKLLLRSIFAVQLDSTTWQKCFGPEVKSSFKIINWLDISGIHISIPEKLKQKRTNIKTLSMKMFDLFVLLNRTIIDVINLL